MESVVHSALEEICLEGARGLALLSLWPKLQSSLTTHGLPLCPNVKAALWSNLVSFPGLQFQAQGSSYDCHDDAIQSVEQCEQINLNIIASEGLRDSFLGMYDVDASVSSVDEKQRRVLERLAIARYNGITQNELAKELKMKGNSIFYILKKLESRGLIVRQSTVVKTKEVFTEGEPKNSTNVITNMVYLYRYAKHLGCQQRIEIVREDKPFTDECDDGDVSGANEGAFCDDHVEENVQVKDFLPAMESICDKLEQTDGKVLVVSDIKRDLGYRGRTGNRTWRFLCDKLKIAHVVEDCFIEVKVKVKAKVKAKEVKCLRLLKKFSPKHFEPNSCRQGYDERDPKQPKSEKRGQITDQLVELPIEHQIYDMIDAEGHKGLTIMEICKRLGLCNKQYYHRLLDMSTRFGMHLQAESKNRGVAYRVWTSGNFNSEVSNIDSCYPKTVSHEITVCDPCPLIWEPNNSSPLIQEVDASTSRNVKAADGTANEPEISCDSTANENDKMMLLPLSISKNSASEDVVEVSNAEVQIESTISDVAQPETSPATSSSKRRRQSDRKYPCLTLSAAIALREQRILEMLEEEKILIKPELHRRLENLEKEKNSMMDRKTLRRSLDKLQQEGRCKCIVFRIPAVTNCGRSRTTEVVLHPSISNMSPEVASQIHERLRSFEIQLRRQSYSQSKGLPVPVLDSVERIPVSVHLDSQAEQAEARRANGFVLAKMVRTKLLHIFLWGYLSSSPGWDDLLYVKHGDNIKNPHSTSKLFRLDAAIKAMPVELFLQVVGSTQKFEDLIEKCKKGLCLSDLRVQEYRSLMDTRATGRLSWLIDILLRLKLIRLVRMGPADDEAKVDNTTLTHALELKPYIEEPVSIVSLSSEFIFPDLRPHIRHDFVLSTRKAVDEYWSTLEYCYSAANSKAALHAFPGSAVHEIFTPRSWASVRVMTADQRAKLLKRLAVDEPHKKLSLNECRKISKDLNMTLGQVLRIYDDKRQQRFSKLPGDSYTKADVVESLTRTCSSSRKRKRYVEGKSFMDGKSASGGGPLSKHRLGDVSVTSDQLTERQNSFLKTLGDHEIGLLQDLSGDLMEITEEQESHVENEHDPFFIHSCTLSRLKSGRKRKFSWTEAAERQLVIEYVRHRASLGVKFHRTDWSSLSNLPAPPEVCRRRMALLNSNVQFRKVVMRLCNMLSERYTKKLEKFENNLSNLESAGVLVREPIMQGDSNQNVVEHFEHNVELETEECWDNFDDSDIKTALDDVLRLRRAAKLNSKAVGSDEWFGRQDSYDTESVPSAHMNQKDEIIGQRSKLSARRSRSRCIAQKYNKLLNEGTSINRRVYESVAVSNAAELFKLIFLSNSITPQASTLLAETLRHYSQHDLFAAFSYLRENKIMIGGDGTTPFALSRDFLHNISLSLFPTNTGKRALKFASWLVEIEKDLMEGEVNLPTDLQCGDIFHLCALVSNMELSITPCLPEEGIGEAEDSRTSKRQIDSSLSSGGDKSKRLRASMAGEGEIISRREKGFPGIKLSLNCAIVPRMHTLDMFKGIENNCVSLFVEKGQNKSTSLQFGSSFPPDACASARVRMDNWDIDQTAAVAHKSPWEAMTSYAELLISSFSHEGSSFLHPELFRTICSAIQKSGDQGLSMKAFSKVLNLSGQRELEIIVDVLEAFGRAFKVCAYDSIHVVDTLYRPKYLLSSIEAVQIPEINPPVDSPGKHDDVQTLFNVANQEDNVSSLPDEMRIDGDDVHRITILNHPKEFAKLSSDVQSTTEVEDSTHSDLSAGADPTVETSEIHSFDPHPSRPILPWINGNGTINELVYKGLVRRILGIVMQNPGILEDEIIKHMRALNPQSCRKLLEKLILDNHIMVKRMHQTCVEPPAILDSILGRCPKNSKIISRDHFFANPLSTTLL